MWVSSVFPIRFRKKFQRPLWYYQQSMQSRLNAIPRKGRKSRRASLRSVYFVTPLQLAGAQTRRLAPPPTVYICREDSVQMARWWCPFYRRRTEKSKWENSRECSFPFLFRSHPWTCRDGCFGILLRRKVWWGPVKNGATLAPSCRSVVKYFACPVI